MKRSIAVFAGLSVALVLTACQPQPAGSRGPPIATVVAAEAALTAAGRIVLGCYAVPSCSAIAPKDKIKVAYDAAYDAVTAAQRAADAGGSPSMTAVSAALAALQDVIATLP